MKITAKCYYALIASVELSRRYGQGPLRASAIAEQHEIPVRFLELILNDLRNGDIVDSKRGSDGGFFLKSSPEDIRVYDIYKAIDGELSVVDADKLNGGECMLKKYMHGLRANIFNYLNNTNLKELTEMCKDDAEAISYII